MKTHQEIRDVIQKFKLPLAAQDDLSDEFSDILEILHALNDRIEAVRDGLNLLERMTTADKVQDRLEEIHPTRS